MPYVGAWERLSSAVKRLTTVTGLSTDQVQADICSAIADRAIKVRVKLKKHVNGVATASVVLDGEDVQIPPEIRPEHFSWEESRPLDPWAVPNKIRKPGLWWMEWIKVSVSDVVRVLCEAASGKSAPDTARRSIKRTQPAREPANWVLMRLYPNGNVPPQGVLPNWQLCRRVNAMLTKQQMPIVSDDTILRAAGRRK
jgi:hypothetical protein